MSGKILADYLKDVGAVKTETIYKAFAAVDRANFILPEYGANVYDDIPLPIGHGATISQPYTVAFMLELLELESGQKILDVGSGSGWTTALLAHIVGPKGKVYGVELIPELVEFSRKNLRKAGVKNAQIFQAKPSALGLPDKAPFDRILVSAAARDVSQELISQLKSGGITVQPVQSSIFKIIKKPDGTIQLQEFPGFAFVPLIKQ